VDLSCYITKTVPFKFRGINFIFDLSQGLFSSEDIDSGTRLLLKVLSKTLDEDAKNGKAPPQTVLDAGCGIGVIGICAAAAIGAMKTGTGGLVVRAQDRDELARVFTEHNAKKNKIPAGVLKAHTEPMLAGADNYYDLILCNIPAKAGLPVLEDFICRAAAMLAPGGKVVMVAVHTLANFFREKIKTCGAEFILEDKSAEYSVFVYGKNGLGFDAAPAETGKRFLDARPFYIRNSISHSLEDITVNIKTVYGAPGFDDPGGAVIAAAKLMRRIGARHLSHNADAACLVHEGGQGFFSCWLPEFFRKESLLPPPLVLSGRNILALEAARHNAANTESKTEPVIVPAADLTLAADRLLEAAAGLRRRQYGFIAAFPEILAQSRLAKGADQFKALWEALPALLAEGGVFIAGFSSSNAQRFDRVKPAGFSRLGDIKRNGFRALGYVYT